jgi:hypothetical protein
VTISYAQFFCTVADLVSDKQAPGLDETRMFQAIRDASDFVQKHIGWFIPVTLTRSFQGNGSGRLALPAMLLGITSITNDGVTLATTDYVLKPDDGYWASGPFGELHVDEDSNLLSAWSEDKNGVAISGRWGMFERSGISGATVQDTTQQSDSQRTLKVSDGGKVSPGMVLLIGSEQEAVTGWEAPTEAVTVLNGAITAADEIITVDNGALVHSGEILRVDFEQMKIKDIRSNQCSVIRSWNGTGKVAHADDKAVDVYRTVTVDRGVNGTTAAVHANGVAISRYFVPDDILYLTKEIATLSANKAQGGYQGRTGNDQTGVVFYNDAFPQFDIQKIKENYYIPRLS